MSKHIDDPIKSKGLYWQSISRQLHKDEISHFDRQTLDELCGVNNKWIDMIPRGLMYSYSYLYHCVKGLGCEDGEAIEKDVLRTVGAVKDGPKVFGDTSELGKAGTARAMHRLLTALSITDSMGYCQGMNYVADYLLKLTSEEESFCLFLFALRCRHLCCIYETKLPVLSDFMEVFELQLAIRLPLLASTLKERGFIAPFYSIEWFTTLFTLACPFELTSMIFDLFFAGLQDVQIRCAIAIMEILEPKLLLMSVEELLKEFRHMCQGVETTDVILRALRIQLSPIKMSPSQSLPSGMSRPHYLLDCKYYDDRNAETLLALRLRYINEAAAAMQERDADCGRWVKGRTSLRLTKNLSQQTNETDDARPLESTQRTHTYMMMAYHTSGVALSANDEVAAVLSAMLDSLSSDYKGSQDFPENIEIPRETDEQSVNMTTAFSRYRDSLDEGEPPSTNKQAIDFLSDPSLMCRVYELKQIITTCDRIAQWVQLNQKWVECLSCMKSDLEKYNIADHLLRYCIASNAHVRTVLFFLSVAGADPNSQDRWLRTPLHYAAVFNRPDVVRGLLLAGADPTVKGALRPPILDHVPTALTSATQLAINSGSPSVAILKGKACISCNTLFNGANLKKMACQTCDIALCAGCLKAHNCVWQHGSVAGARNKLAAPVNSPHRRYRSGSLTESDDASDLSLPEHNTVRSSGGGPGVVEENTTILTPGARQSHSTPSQTNESIEEDCSLMRRDHHHHVGVLLHSLDTDVDDGDDVDHSAGKKIDWSNSYDQDQTVMSRQDSSREEEDTGSVDSGFGSVGEEGRTALCHSKERDDCTTSAAPIHTPEPKKIEYAVPELTNSSSQNPSRRHSATGLMSWIKSNKFSRMRSASGDVSGQHEISNLTDSRSNSPRPVPIETERNPTPVGEEKMSRKKRLSVALGNSFKKLTGGISRKGSGTFASSRRRSANMPPEGYPEGMPLYWVGYRDDESYLIRLQPWQALLLPLVFGAEENRSNMAMEDVRLNQSNGHSGGADVCTLQPFTVEEEEDIMFLKSQNLLCEICDRQSAECTCSTNYPFKKHSEMSVEAPHLYFRQEMAFFYALLKRDADMLAVQPPPVQNSHPMAVYDSDSGSGMHILTETSSHLNRADASEVDSNQPEIDHLRATLADVTAVFDDAYVMGKDANGEEFKGMAGSVSTDNGVKIQVTGHHKSGIHGGDVDSAVLLAEPSSNAEVRVNKSLQSTEELRQDIVKRFVSGFWAIEEDGDFWVPDDSAWYCRKCSSQFSLFMRKHHCRRCGGVFCADDAPHVDMLDCLPESFKETLRKLLLVDSSIDKKQFRLCDSCKLDLRHCTGLLLELDMALPQYTLAFWLSTLSAKSYRVNQHNDETDKHGVDLKDVRLGRFPVAGQWVDSMADWLWRDKLSTSL